MSQANLLFLLHTAILQLPHFEQLINKLINQLVKVRKINQF